jgi:PTH1 family peptidyl-tRNA hydrolase
MAVIDVLAQKTGIKVNRLRHKGPYRGRQDKRQKGYLLVKPQTFMNQSGECLRDIVEWYKDSRGNIIVIYDDADLPAGTLRIRPGAAQARITA